MERRLVKSKKVTRPALYGAIAQLGERIVRNDEVVGSIPTSSTMFSSTSGERMSARFRVVSLFVS